MRQNALLRSGKGLDAPSTARKNVTPVAMVESVPADEREDHFALRDGVRCAGVHLIIDLHGAQGLDDIDLIEATLRRCVDAAQATLLHIHLHHFQPNGVSGVAVLAESHISIHTWPDAGYAALDVFMCGKASSRRLHPCAARGFQGQTRRGERNSARAETGPEDRRTGRRRRAEEPLCRDLPSVADVRRKNAGFPKLCSTTSASA